MFACCAGRRLQLAMFIERTVRTSFPLTHHDPKYLENPFSDSFGFKNANQKCTLSFLRGSAVDKVTRARFSLRSTGPHNSFGR